MRKDKLKIGLINTGLDETSPPLNLAYLAASLRSKGFSDVKIIDRTFYPWRDVVKEAGGADLIAISAITKYYKKACGLARRIKRALNVPLIIGGVHISTAPFSLSPDFALGILGEGEKTITELCVSFYEEGKLLPEKLKQIPGLVYWDKAGLVRTGLPKPIGDIDNIPMPDFGLLDRHYFRKRWINWAEAMGRHMHIITSRGCPYDCVFCAATRFWRKTRFYSPARVCKEMNELINKYGVDHITIDDDLFLSNKKRLEEITSLLERNNLTGRVRFSCMARSDLLDDDMCRILKGIGVRSMNFGFESGSNRVLQYLKSGNITVEDHKNAIGLCNKYGFKVYGSLMFANPTETVDDMKKTLDFIDFAIKNRCRKIVPFVTTPLPGTPFWEMAKKQKKVSDHMDWDLLDLNNSDNPMFLEPDISPGEFKKIFNKARGKLNKAWMKDRWLKTLIFERQKVIRRVLQNPGRALSTLKDMFCTHL